MILSHPDGASAGSVSSFAERAFNVKSYGATGDGSTDDTTNINAAVAAAVAEGGGTVYFPPGTYRAQGINLAIGVSFKGAGSVQSATDAGQSSATSKIIALASPTAATPIFRFAKGSTVPGSGVTMHYGGSFQDLVISGGLNSESVSAPSAVSSALVVGIDARTTQKQTCTFTAATDRVTAVAHGLSANDMVQFEFAPTATAPTLGSGTFYSNFTYFVKTVVDADNFTISATAGGSTIDLTSAGTGTFYVGKGLWGIRELHINRCVIKHCDIGIRGSCLYDLFRVHDCRIAANWAGILGEEHPMVTFTHLEYNRVGMTGRFLDMNFTNNYVGGGKYGVASFGAEGVYGTTLGQYDQNRLAYINGCVFTANVFYKNELAGVTPNLGCTVNGNLIVGDKDAHADSVGVRVNGNDNSIVSNMFGEFASSSSFGRCAIALDKGSAGGSSSNDNTSICNNTFRLAGCPAIQSTSIESGVYGAASQAKLNLTVNDNVLVCSGDRLLHLPLSGATVQNATINANTITSNGTNGTAGATGGFIECAFYTNNIVRDNIVVGSAVGQFVVKDTMSLAVTGMFDNNRTTAGTAALDFSSVSGWGTVAARARENTGTSAVDALNNPKEIVLASNFTRAGTLADVTGMSFATGANEAYKVELNLACSSNNTTNDIILDLVSTGTPFVTTSAFSVGTHYSAAGALTARAATAFSSTSAALGSLVVNDGDGVVRPVTLEFYFTTGSATTIKLQAGCPTAGTATIYAGARMTITRIR